jgi:hypothetical protein
MTLLNHSNKQPASYLRHIFVHLVYIKTREDAILHSFGQNQFSFSFPTPVVCVEGRGAKLLNSHSGTLSAAGTVGLLFVYVALREKD